MSILELQVITEILYQVDGVDCFSGTGPIYIIDPDSAEEIQINTVEDAIAFKESKR